MIIITIIIYIVSNILCKQFGNVDRRKPIWKI